jgi:hypothetical protein
MNKKQFTGGLLLAVTMFAFSCSDDENSNVWTGKKKTFSKSDDSDWTLAINQDKITKKTIFTRQDAGPIYNYQWFQDNFGEDATYYDLCNDFWTTCGSSPDDHEFEYTGGTQGIKWALLDDTGADNPWDPDFNLYGKLGKPNNFYSFHNIASMIMVLNNGDNVLSVIDNFYIGVDTDGDGVVDDEERSTVMPELVGKKLGVWLVEENIYFTLTFTQWGVGDAGSNAIAYTRSTK